MRVLNMTVLIFLFIFTSNAFSKETILVSANEFPPYTSREFKDQGFLCKLIAESFAMEGIEVKYRFLPAKRSFLLLERGRMDGIVGSYETSKFEKDFYISDSLIIDTISFFYLISSDFDWNTFEDLKGIRVGGTLGYDYGQEFQRAEKSKLIRIQRTTRNTQNFGKLLKKRIKVFPMSTLPGYVVLYKNFKEKDINQITNHSKPVHSTHLYLLLSKKNKQNKKRMTIFNQSLKKLKERGKYDQYFDETLEFFRKTYVTKK